MESHASLTPLTLVLSLFAGVAAQALARHTRLPAIVLLLTTGALLGPDGLGWIEPASLGDGLLLIVELAVAVILFEGGLNLQLAHLRRAGRVIRRLLTVGAAAALGGGALAVHELLGWSWELSLLFGSLIVVTGPTVIGPLIAELRLRTRLATVLEAEGVLIDPIGALLAALALAVAVAPGTDTVRTAGLALLQALGWGGAFGLAGGGLLALALRVRRLVPEGLTNVLVLAWVLLIFQLSEQVARPSGLLAVVVVGMMVGNLRSPDVRELREFKDQLSLMLIGLLFVLLAADVRLAEVRALGWRGAAVVATLVLVVRPLAVVCSAWGSELTLRERLFVAWIAPRGIVAAAIASVTAAELQLVGNEQAAQLRALVFLTIATTVLLAGVTGLPVASLLGVRSRQRDRTAILGANELGVLLGEQLRTSPDSVVFLDTNPENAARAERSGFPVVFGNALEERGLGRARPGSLVAVIGCTANDELNGLFAMRARELFGVPRGYVALRRLRSGVVQEFLGGSEVDALFDAAHDVDRWDLRLRQGDTTLEFFRFAELPEPAPAAAPALPETPPVPAAATPSAAAAPSANPERYLILAVRRGQRVQPMSVRFKLRPDDVAAVLIYAPERAAAHEALLERGFGERVESLRSAEAPVVPAPVSA